MAALSVDSVTAACVANAGEAAAALARCLGGELSLAPGEALEFRPETPPLALRGAGLAFLFALEGGTALFLLPDSAGLTPDWCAAPDATGKSKLATLAQELGMLLLPDDQSPLDFAGLHLPDLAAAVRRGKLATAQALVLELQNRDQTASGFLLWLATASLAEISTPEPLAAARPPAAAADAIAAPAAATPAAAPLRSQPAAATTPNAPAWPAGEDFEDGVEHLPAYTRSLLKIRVTLGVMLAQTKLPVGKIVELYPGSIIAFQKSVEQPLTLTAGGREIAVGEAVKVGDKFGLRIVSMVMPKERFEPLGKAG